MKKAAVVLLALMMALTCAYGFAQANGEEEMTVLGQGEKSVMVLVVDDKGGENAFEVRTDEAFLMDALIGVELIEVEEVSWGYNITMVNGVKADYEKDQAYWSILEFISKEEGFAPLEITIAKAELPEQSIIALVYSK